MVRSFFFIEMLHLQLMRKNCTRKYWKMRLIDIIEWNASNTTHSLIGLNERKKWWLFSKTIFPLNGIRLKLMTDQMQMCRMSLKWKKRRLHAECAEIYMVSHYGVTWVIFFWLEKHLKSVAHQITHIQNSIRPFQFFARVFSSYLNCPNLLLHLFKTHMMQSAWAHKFPHFTFFFSGWVKS